MILLKNNLFFVNIIIFVIIFLILYSLSVFLYKLTINLKLYKNNKKYDLARDTYEFGASTIGNTSSSSSNNFYILAILFILFDTELLFLYPWSLTIDSFYSNLNSLAIICFIQMVMIGLIFEIKNTILNFYKNK